MSRGFQERLCKLWTLMGAPKPVQKTHSPALPWFFRAARAGLECRMLLVLLGGLGAFTAR